MSDEIVHVGKEVMGITGIEAHILLWAFDEYFDVGRTGQIRYVPEGYDFADLQHLRNRLFHHHEHPEWED